MSLEASVHKIREFAKTFAALADIGDALEVTLAAEQKADAAEKRCAAALAASDKAAQSVNLAMTAADKVKAEADATMAQAKADAAAIRKEAKDKADATVAKAKDRADALAEATATTLEKFELQKKTNDEILAMANAQIAHAEAKLSEIRQAIAKITGG